MRTFVRFERKIVMPRGGRRPGAGAPRGNRNALKHGGHSRYVRQRFLPQLAEFPGLYRWFIGYQRRQMRMKDSGRDGNARILDTLNTLLRLPRNHPMKAALEAIETAALARALGHPSLHKIFSPEQSNRHDL